MADLILGNLATLKRWLLPDTWQSETQKDTVIQELGLGVARAIEGFCNRKFGRAVAQVSPVLAANSRVFFCDRYPLESKPTVEMRSSGSDTWTAQSGVVSQWNPNTGIIYFDTPLGTDFDALRVTTTGGFWIDSSETTPTNQPANSTLLPEGIKAAWLIQCRHKWTIFGLQKNIGETTERESGFVSSIESDLLPTVKQALAEHVRWIP